MGGGCILKIKCKRCFKKRQCPKITETGLIILFFRFCMELPHSLVVRDKLNLELKILPSLLRSRTSRTRTRTSRTRTRRANPAQNDHTLRVSNKFWKEVTSKHYSRRKMEKGRSSHSMASDGKTVYIVGGFIDNDQTM